MAYKVKSLHIYPIKSLGGISLDSVNVEKEGFQHDRRWMLINKEGIFMSQREHPKMALFSCHIVDKKLHVNYKDTSISFGLDEHQQSVEDVQVWNSALNAQEVSSEISYWFSDHLGIECKLVAMTKVSNRKKSFEKEPFSTSVSFADGYPILIVGTRSLEYLNEKLDTPLPMNRFRPNIVIETIKEHEEDTWNDLTVNDTGLKVINACARCQVTTINQETIEKGAEPLKTLSTYRKDGNRILFGANTIVTKEGVISVNDVILN